jgi:hypothetical protein
VTACLPLGLSIASHSGLAPARIGGLAADAEAAGFTAVLVAEGHGDALALCHPVAAATSRDRGPDLTPVRELLLAGDRAGAASRVPQQVADAFVARGDARACAVRLAQYRAAGVDLPVLFPMPVSGDWGYERAIAGLAAAPVARLAAAD